MYCFIEFIFYKKMWYITYLYLSLFELYIPSCMFKNIWIEYQNSKAHKMRYLWQFSYPLLHANCVVTEAVSRQRKNSALASIPKTISIGNVRITNRRYNTRVHCACQESRNYIHLQTMKSRFLAIRYFPLVKLFSWSIFYTKLLFFRNNKNNEIREVTHLDRYNSHSKIYLQSYFSSKISLIDHMIFILSRLAIGRNLTHNNIK